MKRITKLFAAIALCCCVTGANAANFFVSANGNDANDGLTKETAVQTLNRIHKIISTEYIAPADPNERYNIFVDGMLDMSKELTSPDATSPDDENKHTGYMPLKNGGRAGFLFGSAMNWNRVDFYGLNALVPMPMPGNGEGKQIVVPTDGFDGMETGRIFAIASGTHKFTNLKFTKATDICSDGGNVMWVRGSDVTFVNCYFTKNYPPQGAAGNLAIDNNLTSDGLKTNGQAGAIFFLGGDYDDPNNPGQKLYRNLYINDCVFDDNMNRRGGAILHSGGGLYIKNSIFMNHNSCQLTQNGSGEFDNHAACIELQNEHSNVIDVVIESSLFLNNAAKGGGAQGGAIRYAVGQNDTKTGYSNITIKDCNFIGNSSTSQGGALFIRAGRSANDEAGKATLKIINTVFRNNEARYDGGAICMQGTLRVGNELTMVNTTIQENRTLGNAGHGAGIVFMNDGTNLVENWNKKIYNCIFENNRATENGTQDNLGNDLQYRSDVWGQIDMVANMFGRAASNAGAPFDDFLGENDINYYSGGDLLLPENSENYTNHPGYDIYDAAASAAGSWWIEGYPSSFYVIPLKEDAIARTYGKAQYRTDYGFTDDILGFSSETSTGECPVGAVQVLGNELSDGTYLTGIVADMINWAYPLSTLTPPVVPLDPDGIDAQNIAKENVFVIAGGSIALANGENTTIELIGLSGAVVNSGIGSVSIENLPQGLYIAKAQVGGNVYVYKFVK